MKRPAQEFTALWPMCMSVWEPEELDWLVTQWAGAGQPLETQEGVGTQSQTSLAPKPWCSQWAPCLEWGDMVMSVGHMLFACVTWGWGEP